MENNEITMNMDVKIDKKPECVRFQQWTQAQVKIEAVKCLPCFLRITFMESSHDSEQQNLTLSINVPGVSITLASSRTKQHTYALCWTQNRKSCFIYFALDTEQSCRRHMKWVRKSIKNLELHQKLLLDERHCSKGGALMSQLTLDEFNDDSVWSHRVSEIYEEIYEPQVVSEQRDSRRVSRRCSRTSLASGIYEEMKLPNDLPKNFDAIKEELPTTPIAPTPPPLPPLPPLRRRFNTYETEEVPISPFPETPIVRCNTNPETDLAKKKKYKNMLDTFFHGNGLRSKRTVSNSESSQEHLFDTTPKQSKTKLLNKVKSTEIESIKFETPTLPNYDPPPIYANDDTIAAKRQKKPIKSEYILAGLQSKRNSFSSPDLSKINFVDTFDEQRIAELLNPSFLKCDELDLANNASLDESAFVPAKTSKYNKDMSSYQQLLERQNISMRLPKNFNLSACNTSSINLVAPLSSHQPTKNKIIHDDLTGYCVMAPIVQKMSAIDNTPLPGTTAIAKPLESVSSGYSTGSCQSSTASSTNDQPIVAQEKNCDESVVYMKMEDPALTSKNTAAFPLLDTDFTGNLYENLLAVKAARELEPQPIHCSIVLSTSTPTESPHLQEISAATSTKTLISTKNLVTTEKEEEEDYYQTPRKSIISIDEKIPSYYPNTCELSVKSRRRSYSPANASYQSIGNEETTPTSSLFRKSPEPLTLVGSTGSNLRQLVSGKLRRERKENLNLASPQGIIEHRKTSKTNTTAAMSPAKISKSKKTAAHKISENVYAVKHHLKKSVATEMQNFGSPRSNYDNNIVVESKNSNEASKNQSDVLDHLAILRKTDFKFEDSNIKQEKQNIKELKSPTKATHRLPLSPTTTTHHLQVNQSANTCHKFKSSGVCNSATMTQSAISNSACKNIAHVAVVDAHSPTTSGVKKFASLPRFKKFDLSPLRIRINNVLQRNHTPDL